MATFKDKLKKKVQSALRSSVKAADKFNRKVDPFTNKVGEFSLDISVRPTARLAKRAQLSLQGKSSYKPKSATDRYFLGKDRVTSFEQGNKELTKKLKPYIGNKATIAAPALIAVGSALDIVPLGVDDVLRNAGKKGAKEIGEQALKKGGKEIAEAALKTKVTKLDDAIKRLPKGDIKNKAKLLKQRDEILDQLEPTRKTITKQMGDFHSNLASANKERSAVQKQVNSVTQKLKNVKQDITKVYDDSALSQAEKKIRASKLYAEKDKLEELQKRVIQERANIGKVSTVPKTVSSVVKKISDTRPTHQARLERAANAGNWEEVDSILKSIPDTDPYKASMTNLFGKFSKQETPKVASVIENIPTAKPKTVKDAFAGTREEFINAYKSLTAKYGDTDVIERLEKGEFRNLPEGKKLKEITNKMYETTKKVIKERTGNDVEMGKVDDYLPRIYSGTYKDTGHELGKNLMDMVEDFYTPLKSRVNKVVSGGYVKDPEKIIDDYIGGVAWGLDSEVLNAGIKGTKVEGEKILSETAKEIGKAIKETGQSNVDVVTKMKEVSKAFGDELPTKTVVPKLSKIERGFYDDQLFLDELKLTEPLKRFLYSDELARSAFWDASELVKTGKYDEAAAIIKTQLPELDTAHLANYVRKSKSFGATPEEAFYNFVKKSYRNAGIEDMRKFVSTLEFEDVATKTRFNSILNEIVGRDAYTKNLATKLLGAVRKQFMGALLGVNVSSMVQNLTESRRLFGVMSPLKVLKAHRKAFAQGLGKEPDVIARFGLEDIIQRYDDTVMNDATLKGAAKTLAGKYDKLIDASMVGFRKSENIKNRVFLNAFEVDGIEKGLRGNELKVHILNNFYKYAIPGGKLSKTGLIRGEKSKTLLQFGQYSARELGIIMNKAKHLTNREEKALEYLLSLGITSYATYKAYEALGMSGQSAIPSMPGGRAVPNPLELSQKYVIPGKEKEQAQQDLAQKDIPDFLMGFADVIRGTSPTATIALDTIFATIDYLAGVNQDSWGNLSEDGRVDDYLEYRLKKDISSMAFPGANQLLNKTVGYLRDYDKGYSATVSGDKVRFPVEAEIGNASLPRGVLFGTSATPLGNQFWEESDAEGKHLNLNDAESDKYREILATQGRDAAIQYWNDMYNNKKSRSASDDLISASKAYDKTNGTDTLSTATDVLLKDAQDDEAYTDIKKYDKSLLEMLKAGDIDKQEYEKRLSDYTNQTHGWSLEDYRNRIYSGTDLTAKQKSQIVTDYINSGNMDIASWYKSELLTLAVAKELEREGIIESADELWEKAKMTDPYYQKKELKELREKAAKERADTVEKILKANTKYKASSLRLKAKGVKRYKPKLTNKVYVTPAKLRKSRSVKDITSKARSLESVRNKIKKIGESTFEL